PPDPPACPSVFAYTTLFRSTAFKQDDVALSCLLGPILPLQQLNLKSTFSNFVLLTRHTLFIRVVLAPSLNGGTIRHNQARIILVRVVDDITVGLRQIDYWQFIIFNISHAASLIAKSISGAVSNPLFITNLDQQSPRLFERGLSTSPWLSSH